MSRGYGTIQRAILAEIEKGWSGTSLEMAVIAYGIAPAGDGHPYVSNAQHAAVRRALGRFAEKGLVVRSGRTTGGVHWMGPATYAKRQEEIRAAKLMIFREFGVLL